MVPGGMSAKTRSSAGDRTEHPDGPTSCPGARRVLTSRVRRAGPRSRGDGQEVAGARAVAVDVVVLGAPRSQSRRIFSRSASRFTRSRLRRNWGSWGGRSSEAGLHPDPELSMIARRRSPSGSPSAARPGPGRRRWTWPSGGSVGRRARSGTWRHLDRRALGRLLGRPGGRRPTRRSAAAGAEGDVTSGASPVGARPSTVTVVARLVAAIASADIGRRRDRSCRRSR